MFRIVEVDTHGFSRGYTVVGNQGREWNVKLPPEAFSEITASRILWGVGYHQPPMYLVQDWSSTSSSNPHEAGRFREKRPDLQDSTLMVPGPITATHSSGHAPLRAFSSSKSFSATPI